LVRKKVEMIIILTGFPPETCGNDERKQAVNAVIFGPACRLPAGRQGRQA